ncbi:BREX system serine/threonine kinase PglW [Nocardioides sp. GY 10127]|uniref:BREX system serine/threonine kinase PglW n=1 Tax=Nocardioides sp. GY 10127 TaxID=2569762 RepID=UPI0010A7F206|nr:BREX system serine/threonine kinase PglW [Nocardioides sp. GY 10127]TIC84440.1 BREX system serine/threonine kinase PglW [Nocardioides sp. GY 10127]
MRSDSNRWVEVARSEHAHERAGLEHVRDALPDAWPYFAWSNVELVAVDGTPYEIDLIVLGPAGFHLVELKAWSGVIEMDRAGGEHDWLENQPGRGRPLRRRSPLPLTRRKAQAFRSWLEHHARGTGTRIPWVAESLFLHGANVDCRLPARMKQRVFGLEGAQGDDDGLLPLVTARLSAAPERGPAVDAAWAKGLVNLVSAGGLRRPTVVPRVGHWVLQGDGAIDTGWGWRDDLAHHERFADEVVRVRRWFVPPGTSATDEAAVRRAADREYSTLRGLDHPGLVVPRDSFEVEGAVAALVFDHDPAAVPLRTWVASPDLTLESRLDLLRSLAEVVRYAHGHGLAHRGLDPEAVLVDVSGASPAARVKDWQLGGGLEPASATATTHARDLVVHESREAIVYAAPEVITGAVVDRRAADVWSLGALAHLVLTGHDPASNLAKLSERLGREDGLDVSVHLDSPPDSLVLMVQMATAPVVGRRLGTVEQLLDALDAVLDELTRPDDVAEEPPRLALDPFDAAPGDELEGGLVVERLLGEGATSRAYRVRRTDGSTAVLKAARDDARAPRLHEEAHVLAGLPADRELVHLLDGPVLVGGRTCLLVEHAGDETLAQQLGGRSLTLDQLRRWGADLLRLLQVIERAGVFHRDLKPANLGVRLRSGDGQKHLVLFDFSLAAVGIDDLAAGTAGYRDPFLGTGRRRVYDAAAEQFAAAVTLHEMATGSLPTWGDGRTPPEQQDTEVTLRHGAFDLAVADGLLAFFRRALARDARSRFDNAEQMLTAWERLFADADERQARRLPDELASAATLATPLARSGLTPAAVSAAAERHGVSTVGDLLGVPVFDLARTKGATQSTKDELTSRVRAWRERLLSTSGPATRSVDAVVGRLLPAGDDEGARAVRLMLGQDDPVSGASALRWPTQQTVVDEVLCDRKVVAEAWAAFLGAVPEAETRELRDDVSRLLGELGGVATADELAARLLDARGSYADEPLRTAQAQALVRVVADADQGTLAFGRSGDTVLLAGGDDLPDGTSRQDALDVLKRLGHAATDLAARTVLVPAGAALEELRAVARRGPLEDLPDERLRDVAAAAGGVAVSGRGELYPRGMAADRAVLLCAQSLVPGPAGFSEASVAQRVRARFPQARPLPGRPRLDELLAVDALQLRWDGSVYRSRVASAGHTTGTLTSTSHHGGGAAEVDRTSARLAASAAEGSFLALSVPLREARRVVARLAAEHGAEVLDLGVATAARLHELAAANRADWPAMVALDAPGAPVDQHRQLGSHLRAVAERLLAERLTTDGPEAPGRPLVVTGAGLLARHRATDLVKPLASLQRAPGRAVWLVAPQPTRTTTPTLDGAALPLDSPTSQWLAVPRTWASPGTLLTPSAAADRT